MRRKMRNVSRYHDRNVIATLLGPSIIVRRCEIDEHLLQEGMQRCEIISRQSNLLLDLVWEALDARLKLTTSRRQVHLDGALVLCGAGACNQPCRLKPLEQ